MEILTILSLVALFNTALVQLVKWAYAKTGGILAGTPLVITSWALPLVAALLAKATGYVEMSLFGAILAGGMVAATSNKVFDFFAWIKAQV